MVTVPLARPKSIDKYYMSVKRLTFSVALTLATKASKALWVDR